MRFGPRSVVLALATTLVTSTAHGQVFTRIIGTGDPAPGTNFALLGMDEPPGMDGDHIAFIGFHQAVSGAVHAIYSNASGTMSEVVRTGDIMPTEGVPFEFLIRLTVDGDDVAFMGSSFVGAVSRNGIYSNAPGALTELVDMNTFIPGGTGRFTQIAGQDFSFGDGLVAFNGSGSSSQRGIYAIDVATGGISRIVDGSMEMPGQPGIDFTTFGSPGVRDGQVVFPGRSGLSNQGVYRMASAPGGTLEIIADTTMAVPGGGGVDFGGFGGSFVDNGAVLFHTYLPSNALWCQVNGNLVRMADGADPVPGGVGSYGDFRAYGLSNGTVVFDAYDWNTGVQAGIFANACGSFEKVLAPGDTLDGKQVVHIRMDEDSVDGDRVAMLIYFTDGSSAIYVADLSEFENYGNGYAPAGRETPTLSGIGCGTVGSNVTVRVRRGPDAGIGFLVLGGTAANVPFAGGGTLLASPDQLLAISLNPPSGNETMGWLDLSGPIPASVSGTTFHMQALLTDPNYFNLRHLSGGLRLAVP